MNTQVDVKVLSKAARAVKGIAGNGSFMPILSKARITTKNNEIEILGTNMESWIKYSMFCDADAGAQVFIDAGVLNDAVKGSKGFQSFGINAGVLNVGALHFEGCADDALDFPIQTAHEFESRIIEFSGRDFKQFVKRNKATSQKIGQTTRINLTCVNAEYNKHAPYGARFTTTDGYSLNNESYGEQLDASENTGRVLIPMEYLTKAAAAAGMKDTITLDVLSSADGAVVRVSIASTAGDIEYYIRTIAEDFPDFQRVIPPMCDALAVFDIDADALARAVNAAKQVAPEDSRAVKLTICTAFEGAGYDSLEISASSRAGSFTDSIAIIRPAGIPFGAELKPVYFDADYLSAIAGFEELSKNIRMYLYAPLHGARITYNEDQVAVLMPVNIT